MKEFRIVFLAESVVSDPVNKICFFESQTPVKQVVKLFNLKQGE